MINGKETFIRFLKSIKIENFEDFDMEFLNIGRSKTEDNTYFYSIQKDSPWTFKLTQQFIQALSNIVSYRYEIITAYTTAVNSDTYTLFKGPGQEFQDYLNRITGYSEIKTTPGDMTISDRIVTLSTCTGNEATRYVVQGKRVDALDVEPQRTETNQQ